MYRIALLAATLCVPRIGSGQQTDLGFIEFANDGQYHSVAPAKQPAGGTVTFGLSTFRNFGPGNAGTFKVGIFASRGNQTWDAEDILIHSLTFGTMPNAVQQNPMLFQITLPTALPPDKYRLLAVIDYETTLDDPIRDNNVRMALPEFTVVAPVQADLVAFIPPKSRFAVGASDQPLQNSAANILVAPQGVFFLRNTAIYNVGSQSSGSFSVAYYISKTPTVTPDDHLLTTVAVTSIGADTQREIPEQRFVVPREVAPASASSAGDYFFVVVVDVYNEVGELAGDKETNNATFVVPLKVLNAARDTVPVWRVQLLLKTGTRPNAATDDAIFVAVSDRQPFWVDRIAGDLNLDGTWLDYAHNDFEQGDVHTYELRSDNIKRLGDLQRIQIGKVGSDGWCVAVAALKVNNEQVFRKDFGGNCDYLDGDHREHQIGYLEMRTHPDWPRSNDRFIGLPSGFKRDDIQAMIETEVGHFTYGTKTSWFTFDNTRMKVVKSSSSPNSLFAQIGLKRVATGPDAEILISFTIVFSSHCDGAVPVVEAEIDNVDTSVRTSAGFLALDPVARIVLNTIRSKIRKAIDSRLAFMRLGAALPLSGRPVLVMNSAGDITFTEFVPCQ
jgi:hypothetical protein